MTTLSSCDEKINLKTLEKVFGNLENALNRERRYRKQRYMFKQQLEKNHLQLLSYLVDPEVELDKFPCCLHYVLFTKISSD
jgi:hypothetical protein